MSKNCAWQEPCREMNVELSYKGWIGRALAAMLCCMAFAASGNASRVVHVAPGSPGARDGSAERPFASPQEAQKALRARMASEGRGGWTVEIAAGEAKT